MVAVHGLEQVVERHQRELRAQYRQCQPTPRRRRPGSRRQRLGWALVEVGLKLALPAGGRPERA